MLASVNVLEKVISGELEITKVYASAETQILLPEVGIKFGIYDNNDKLIKEVTTDNNGKIKVTLPFGEYTLKQLTTTPGYEYAEDYKFNIDTDGEEIKEVISNAEITAKLKVIKIDADTKEVIKRANIKFKIFDVDKNEYVCQTITYPTAKTLCEFETDENGILITPYPLFSGTYKLEEVDQVIDGYLWNKESVEFRIDENSNLITDNEYGILFETKFENKKVTGSIEIQKYGEEINKTDELYEYNKIPLEGVVIGLYKDDKLIKEYITDSNGYIKIDNLELGEYIIKEIYTVGDHILDTTSYEVILKYKDQYTPVIEYKLELNNYLPKGKLEFEKTNQFNEKVSNALIEVYNENDELLFSKRTNDNGLIVIEGLPIGKYYILERETANPDYILNTEKIFFEIKENNEVVKCNMVNELIIEVPNTEKNELPLYELGAITLCLAGIGVICYASKKKKK